MPRHQTSNLHSRKLLAVIFGPVSLVLLLLLSMSSGSPPQHGVNWQPRPPVAPESVRPCKFGHMCSEVVSGTAGGTWIVTASAEALENTQEYHTATFDQWVLPRSGNSVTIVVRSEAVLDTDAGFPLRQGELPERVLQYLEPTAWVQSDHPEIVSQADALVDDAQREAEAVVAILDWVRANIVYDYSFYLDTDALSVYRNRSGVCGGFSNLSVALLRAVGIPARVQGGCAMWRPPHGGGHAWIEVYYADVGWVPSEPQTTENYVTAHVVGGNNVWCGRPETTIRRVEGLRTEEVYGYRTAYSDDIWSSLTSAFVPSWDRRPIRVSPPEVSFLVSASDTEAMRTIDVESTACYTTAWSLEPEAEWLGATPTNGNTRTQVLLSVDAASLAKGFHTTSVEITTDARPYGGSYREVSVKVWVVDQVYQTFLPLGLSEYTR